MKRMLKLLDHQLNVLSELKSIHTEKILRRYCLLLLNILLAQLALASLEIEKNENEIPRTKTDRTRLNTD